MLWLLFVALALCVPAALANEPKPADPSEFYHALFVRCNLIHEVYMAIAVLNSQGREADRNALIDLARVALLRETNPHTQCEDFSADFMRLFRNDVLAGYEARIEQIKNFPAQPPAQAK
jgi:hypothetical protein